MKKIFILFLLIIPIMAHATDPVGPAHVNSGAVVATAPAPYAIATPETGDTTNVVSASYVKGAYNDAIAAVNKVNADKQDKLVSHDRHGSPLDIQNSVVDQYEMADLIELKTPIDDVGSRLITAQAALQAALNLVEDRVFAERVNAVTTWGNDTPTQLPLSTASNYQPFLF